MIADNPDDFASHTVELLKNPRKCVSLARKGRADVERLYGWDAMGREINEAYESFIREYEFAERGQSK